MLLLRSSDILTRESINFSLSFIIVSFISALWFYAFHSVIVHSALASWKLSYCCILCHLLSLRITALIYVRIVVIVSANCILIGTSPTLIYAYFLTPFYLSFITHVFMSLSQFQLCYWLSTILPILLVNTETDTLWLPHFPQHSCSTHHYLLYSWWTQCWSCLPA